MMNEKSGIFGSLSVSNCQTDDQRRPSPCNCETRPNRTHQSHLLHSVTRLGVFTSFGADRFTTGGIALFAVAKLGSFVIVSKPQSRRLLAVLAVVHHVAALDGHFHLQTTAGRALGVPLFNVLVNLIDSLDDHFLTTRKHLQNQFRAARCIIACDDDNIITFFNFHSIDDQQFYDSTRRSNANVRTKKFRQKPPSHTSRPKKVANTSHRSETDRPTGSTRLRWQG